MPQLPYYHDPFYFGVSSTTLRKWTPATLRKWTPANRRRLPAKLSFVAPAMVNNVPHSLIDEDLLEEADYYVNIVHVRLYGRQATKRNIDKWVSFNWGMTSAF